MREIDFKSTLIAGGIGAVLLTIVGVIVSPYDQASVLENALVGFVLGAGLQVAVRVTGVS
jgi:hypothetical protein